MSRPRHTSVYIFLLVSAFVLSCLVAVRTHAPHKRGARAGGVDRAAATADTLARLPMHFEANRGQADARVKFTAAGPGYKLHLTPTEAVLSLSGEALRMSLDGARGAASVEGEGELPGRSNYLLGGDASRWVRDVPHFARVRYREVYGGVDLVYYGNHENLEYDFHVAPGADPRAVRLRFDGARRVSLGGGGELNLELAGGSVTQHPPVAYQEVGGARREVAARYRLLDEDEGGADRASLPLVGFELGAYDPELPLVIDPVLTFSTYLGGSRNDQAWDVAVDAGGFIYVTGTASAGFPVTGAAYQTATPNAAVFVAKLNPQGTQLVYSTFVGSRASEGGAIGYGVAVDSDGNAYVTGQEGAPDFPQTAGAFVSPSAGGQDAFVFKLNPTGSDLIYSFSLGGTFDDEGMELALDAQRNAFVVGTSRCFAPTCGFPAVNAIQPNHRSSQDAFVTMVNPNGSQLLFSTLHGGAEDDWGHGVALDPQGNPYAAGHTFSGDFPTTPGAFDRTRSSLDAFVTKFTRAGQISYSTLVGGNQREECWDVAVDSAGSAYITGRTESVFDTPTTAENEAFPTTPGAFQRQARNVDAYVAKLHPQGTSLAYSTFLGGDAGVNQTGCGVLDRGFGIAVDAQGQAHVVGETDACTFPVHNAVQPQLSPHSTDAFATKFTADGSRVVYSTYLGGPRFDQALAVALDSSGAYAHVAGRTEGGFPVTAGAFQTTFGGGLNQVNDAFVFKLDTANDQPPPPPTPTPVPPNDDFADAQEIAGCSGSVSANNEGATAQPGEPDHSQNGDPPDHTVWYKFTAFNNAELTLDTAGSDFDTRLTVYTGDAFDNLQFLVANSNVPEGGTHSRVRFNLRTGQTYRVVVDGEGTAAGNLKLNWQASDCATVAPTPSPSPVIRPFAGEQKLSDAGLARNDQLGYQVAVDGDTAVVGAPGDDTGAGCVYVYVRDAAGLWVKQARLVAPDRAQIDFFGAAVAVFGDTVVVGAPEDDLPGAFNQGSAYVFTRDAGGAWAFRQQLTSSDPAQDDQFGFSVKVVANTVVVGEYLDDELRLDGSVATYDRGAAHVFERNPSTGVWTHFQKLTASDGGPGDSFGVNVAFDGSTIVVGAYADTLGTNPFGPVQEGSAYVFTLNVSFRWVELQKLVSPDPAMRDWFGLAVAVYADTIVVGAELDDVGAHPDQGSLYVFTREVDAGEFAFSQKLNAEDGAPYDFLGFSVAIYHNVIVAGAYQDFVGTKLQQGSAYVFARAGHGAPFVQQQKLTSGDGRRADRYGIRVAIDRETVVVGAYLHDTPAGDGGAAYVYTNAAPSAPFNVALAANGGVVTASSTYDSRFPASAVNNGDRKGSGWGAGGGWNDATASSYPDWVQIDFAGPRSITEVNVFTVQDAFSSPAEPTEGMTFTKYGVTNFRVERWTGAAWELVPGGAVTSNRNVWRRLTFAPVTTDRIRVFITGALDGYSRLAEVEAWGVPAAPPPPRTNHALASNGATAAASSSYDSRFPASSVNNGDRRGLNWGAGGGWNDATANAYPDSLEITFAGAKTISEVNVFTVQDNFASPADPSDTMTFTKYGVISFDVQTWDGAQWVTVPGGAVTGNNLVWRRVTFPAVTTTKIRVLVKNALDGYSRLTEVEAY